MRRGVRFMKEQFDKYFGVLTSSKDWQTFAVAGAICLAAVILKEILFLLALVLFGRALWLGFPQLKKAIKDLDKS